MLRHRRTKDAIAVAALAAVWTATLWTALRPGRSYAMFLDNEFLIAPIFAHMSNVLRSGDWPLWMNTLMGGIPLYNTPQFSPWYPFYFLAAPLYENPVMAMQNLHRVTLLHILVLEANTYILLRTVPVSRVAAVTGAAILAFSANMMGYATWVSIVAPYAWLPLYLSALIRLFRARPARGAMAVGTIAATLLTLASTSQALIHLVFITAVYTGYQWLLQRRRERIPLFQQGLRRVAVVGCLSVLLAAPVLLPAFREYSTMIRWIGPFPAVIGRSRIPFNAFLFDQLSIRNLAGVVYPLVKANAIGNQYLGLFPLTLAALAPFSRRRAAIAVPFLAIALYSLLSSAGANLGLAYINYRIPLLNMVREPSRFLVLFMIACSILAAIGADHLRCAAARGFRPKERFLLMALAFGAGAMLTQGSGMFRSRTLVVIVFLVWAALTGALLLAKRFRLPFAMTQALVAGFLLFTLWSGYRLVVWAPPPLTYADHEKPDVKLVHKVMQRVAELDPDHDHRVIIEGGLDKQQVSMVASYYGVRTFNAYYNPLPYVQFLEMYYQGSSGDGYYRVHGAKYVVCSDCPQDAIAGYALKEQIDEVSIYGTDDVAPYYYSRASVDGTFKTPGRIPDMRGRSGLHDGVLYVQEKDQDVITALGAGVGPCTAEEQARTQNRRLFHLDCSAPQVFVLNEYNGGAWKAAVNGEARPVLTVNGNQVGVLVGPGPAELELRYAPTIVRWSLFAASAGLVLFAVMMRYRGRLL